MIHQLHDDATVGAVAAFAQERPRAAVAHPNIDPTLWLRLAGDYRVEALSNPSLALWALEKPEIFGEEALLRRYATDWLSPLFLGCAPKLQHLWAADCIERTLPFYDNPPACATIRPERGENGGESWGLSPHQSPQIRHLIAARRDYANGLLSADEWEALRMRHQNSAILDAWSAAHWAANLVADAMSGRGERPAQVVAQAREAHRRQGRVWQYRRLREIIQQIEAP